METRAWEGEGRASGCREREAVRGKQNRGRSLGEGGRGSGRRREFVLGG